MKKTLLFASVAALAIADAAAVNPDFTHGMFIVNEGSYGANGYLNFLAEDGEMYYKVYSQANPGKTLGITTESGSLYGDRLFLVSKDKGNGQFVAVLDATDMKQIAEISELPGSGTQANYLCPVSETLGFLSTNNGLYPVNLTDYTLGNALTYTGMSEGPFGYSLLAGGRLFVISQRDGVAVVDVKSSTVTNLLDIDKAYSLSLGADGMIYTATGNTSAEFVKIDPATLTTENIDIDATDACVPDPWSMAWVMSPFAASKTGRTLYYATAPWSCRKIGKYDLSSGEYNPDFITLPEDQELYGQGMTVDPSTGNIVVMTVESGWGEHYLQNWIYFFAPDGTQLTDKTKHLDEFLWFPAMALFTGSATGAIDAVEADADALADVYTPSGILVKHAATADDVKALPAGIYIYGHNKVIVK